MRLPAMLSLLLFTCLPFACGPGPSGDAPPTRPRHNLHDLATITWQSTLSGMGRFPPRPDKTLAAGDHRDGLSLVRCPANQGITFPPLTVTGAARLRAGCDTSLPPGAPADDPRRVRYVVEAARVDGAPFDPATLAFTQVAEHTLTLQELQARGAGLIDVELPAGPDASGDTSWVLRFSTQMLVTEHGAERVGRPDEILGLDWPAWTAPTLTSAGRRVPLADDPVLVPDSAFNFLGAFGQAAVLVQDEERPVKVGSVNPLPGSSAGGERAALEVAGNSRVR